MIEPNEQPGITVAQNQQNFGVTILATETSLPVENSTPSKQEKKKQKTTDFTVQVNLASIIHS